MSFNVCPVRYASWHLNQTTGTVVPDNSGHGRNGTTYNMLNSDWVAGKLHNCLLFDGVTKYVSFGQIASFERTQACSYEFWAKFTVTGGAMLEKYDSPNIRGLSIDVNAGGIAFLLAHGAAGNNYLYVQTTSPAYNDGNWHHVVITYNGNSNSSGIHIYVDNTDKTLSIVMDNLSATVLNFEDFCLAKTGNHGYYSGRLDEVVIYDRVLTATEVTGRWNGGVGTEDCRIPGGSTLLSHDF